MKRVIWSALGFVLVTGSAQAWRIEIGGTEFKGDDVRVTPPTSGQIIEAARNPLAAAQKEYERKREELDGLVAAAGNELDKLGEQAPEALKKVAEDAKKKLEEAKKVSEQAVKDVIENYKKSINDIVENTKKAIRDGVEAAEAAGRFIEREIDGYGDTINKAERRLREGKIADAAWHFLTDKLDNTSENAAQLALENQHIGIAMSSAASFYGGPAGAAAYATWMTYKATGDQNLALRVGFATALQSSLGGKASALPAGTAGLVVKKAVFNGAVGGLAVAAAGGDDAAVRDAFLKQGGMVLMQSTQAYVTSKYDAYAAQADSFCSSTIGTSCKPVFDAVERDKNGNIIFNDKGGPRIDTSKLIGGRDQLGKWSDVGGLNKNALPGADALPILNGRFAISWNKDGFTSQNLKVPAVTVTFIGPGSPFDRRITQIAASTGISDKRLAHSPQTPATVIQEQWVALGDVGTSEKFFDLIAPKREKAPIEIGDILRAKTDVNVRPGPANWSKQTVLAKGGIISVSDIVVLKTDVGNQRWARLETH